MRVIIIAVLINVAIDFALLYLYSMYLARELEIMEKRIISVNQVNTTLQKLRPSSVRE